MTMRYLSGCAAGSRATDMRVTETAGDSQKASGAVSQLIGDSLRMGDVDSTMNLPTLTMPSIRISRTATRTTTTRTTSSLLGQSADQSATRLLADVTFEELAQAYFDCRKTKRNTISALRFEQNLESNLYELYSELVNGTYRPGRSICFVIKRPKPREVWAADFRDRIVHHLFYNKMAPRFHASFIADSCACIPKRGTLYAANRLEGKIRSITQNWSKRAFYLKMDLANFFVSIDKHVLRGLVAKKVTEPWWMWLADVMLFHDPRENYEIHGNSASLALVPPHKQLTKQPEDKGLPIGNLISQFLANILLNVLDQYCKHKLKAIHYIRYVDDFILLSESSEWLAKAKSMIEEWLPKTLNLRVNPSKTIIQPIDRGVDFVGHNIKPWCRTTRKRTFKQAIQRIREVDVDDLFATANSYFGLLRQSPKSHNARAIIANEVRRRGLSINRAFTQTYRRRSYAI